MKKFIQNILNRFGYAVIKASSLVSFQEQPQTISYGLINLLLDGTQFNSKDHFTMVYNQISSFDEYQQYKIQMEPIYKKRLQIEKLLAMNGKPFEIEGYNGIIQKKVKYSVDFLYSYSEYEGVRLPNWRESCVCSETNLNNRQRATIQFILSRGFGDLLRTGSVYITEQTTPYFQFLKNMNPNIMGSEYLGYDKKPGVVIKGVRHEDITNLTFKDSLFDMLITNDVLEHVPEYYKAYSEIYRVLKSGGILILTVPFHLDKHEHTIRATLNEDGTINHILPPEYHGDPINPEGGILCFQVFGWKLLDELKEAGFCKVSIYFYWSLVHGFLGREQMVIVGEK